MMKITFNVKEFILGIHCPWIEFNGFNARLLIEDLRKGLPLIGIACTENNYFNFADHWILGLKLRSRFLAKILGFFNSRFIIPSIAQGHFTNSPKYFLHHQGNGLYVGDLPENVKRFVLVIFTKHDRWDGKVYCLPTNLKFKVDEDGILAGENEELRIEPVSLKELWPGNSWASINIK
jgi:hypothetical protein